MENFQPACGDRNWIHAINETRVHCLDKQRMSNVDVFISVVEMHCSSGKSFIHLFDSSSLVHPLFRSINSLAILKKNLNQRIFLYILKNFRMCAIIMEALTPPNRNFRTKWFKDITRSRLVCRTAKGSIVDLSVKILHFTCCMKAVRCLD